MIGSLLGCCACAASGHPAAPPRSLISSRRLMVSPAPRTESLTKEYHIFDRELRRLLDPSGPPLMSALGHVWTAPWQELSDVSAALVGCGHVSGLFVRPMWPLAIMLCAVRVPIVNTHSKMR